MTFLTFEVDATFILNKIDFQMTLTFQQASLEHKHVVQLHANTIFSTFAMISHEPDNLKSPHTCHTLMCL